MRGCHSRSVNDMEIDAASGRSRADMTVLSAWLTTGDPAGDRRLRLLAFWFYVGLPLLLGFLLGWLQVGRAVGWPRPVSLVYWIAAALLSTSILGVTTHVLAPLLRRWRSPLWLTLLAGQLIGGSLLVDPVLQGLRALIRWTLHPALDEVASGPLPVLLQTLPSNTLLWIGLNLLFFHGLQMPRFGYMPWSVSDRAAASLPPDVARAGGPSPQGGGAASLASAQLPQAAGAVAGAGTETGTGDVVAASAEPALPASPPAPVFLDRVRPERRGRLLALQSDGHYLRVHTDAGSDLVLYRLSDAIRELGTEEGAQVHRSWWVAGRALSDERQREVLKLVNGLEVPVSRSFRLAARERGWLL